jgi:ATP-dependent protease ClpP protease subunit
MSDDEKDLTNIRTEGNTIFFFCDVTTENVRDLCTSLKKASMTNDHLKICIQSNGGDVYAGFAALDYMKTLRVPIETVVCGICASAATFILLGGTTRSMGTNSFLLIHQITTELWGTHEELKDGMKTTDQLMKHIKKLYLRETSIPEEKLDKLFQRDIYLSARKCLKYNIVKKA